MPPEVVDRRLGGGERRADGAVVRRRRAAATPAWAHSVHVEVTGLEPARWYWYRFRAGDEVSPVGRTRTAPAADAPLERLRFAFASCQQYEQGYFTAYRHMAADDLDLVVLPRRLHLRSVVGPRPRAPARRAGAAHAGGLPHPPRALQDRPRPAGRARGLSRGSSPGTITRSPTTTRTIARSIRDPPRVVPRAPRRRLPGVLRAHAAAPRTWCPHGPAHAPLRPASRSAALVAVPHARRSPVPLASALRAARPRRLRPSSRIAPSRLDPRLHDARRRRRSAGSTPASTASRSALERHRAADADGPARPQAGAGPAVLDRRLGRLPGRAPAPARLRLATASRPIRW